MPFQSPAGYAPGIQPPEAAPELAVWFVFRGAELLVTAPPEVGLPHCVDPNSLGMIAQHTQYLGVLGERHCYAAELAARAEAPRGWVWQGLRGLFGALDDAHFALAGRALQLVEWNRTHQYCGACGTATTPRTTERSRE